MYDIIIIYKKDILFAGDTMRSNINNHDETFNMAKCPHCGFEFNVEFSCGRCGHKWVPRENGEPKVCPSCKSPYWNKPRVREVAKRRIRREDD